MRSAALHHNHRSVDQMSDALRGILAQARQFNLEPIARDRLSAQRSGKAIDVDGGHAGNLADLGHAEVGRNHAISAQLGDFDQSAIDIGGVDGRILDGDVQSRARLHLGNHVEPTPPARAFSLVRTVGEFLQLVDHRLQHDEWRVEGA